jgi:hypothetical protein
MMKPEARRKMNADLSAMARRIRNDYERQCLETFHSALIRRGTDPDERERLADQLLERHHRKQS